MLVFHFNSLLFPRGGYKLCEEDILFAFIFQWSLQCFKEPVWKEMKYNGHLEAWNRSHKYEQARLCVIIMMTCQCVLFMMLCGWLEDGHLTWTVIFPQALFILTQCFTEIKWVYVGKFPLICCIKIMVQTQ